jgi:hypothetical protein
MALLERTSRESRGRACPGKSGSKAGANFVRFCEVAKKISQVAELQLGCRLQFLVENVWPEYLSDIKYFERALKLKAVAMESAEFGWINRPKIWSKKHISLGDTGTFASNGGRF